MFENLIHADWSMHDHKKWMATAKRTKLGWQVTAPRLVPSTSEFLDSWLLGGQSVLAGFDFPIGLPAAFGKNTGFSDFPQALSEFGKGPWNDFFLVADRVDDISSTRPFYPRTYPKGRRQADLLAALGVKSMDELLRACDRKTLTRRAACSIFWTLGGNQVGKAAIDGWRSVIQPSLRRGARLWPFHGRLDDLSKSSGCVLCETYPQEAYSHLGVQLRQGGSKRRQDDRRDACAPLFSWAKVRGVNFTDELQETLLDGFGPSASGEDPFDALAGLLSMIEVTDQRRAEGSTPNAVGVAWEGWILGQSALS